MAVNVSTGTLGDAAPSAAAFPANHSYYVREFLDIANPEAVYASFGTPRSVPANESNSITRNKVLKLATLEGSTVTEGVTPSEQSLQMVRLTKTVNQYGGYVRFSDRLTTESVNGLTTEFTQRLGEQAGETMNLVLRDDLLGNSNIRVAGGVAINALAAVSSASTLSADIAYMYTAFLNEKVKPLTPMAMGSTSVGTLPQRPAYQVVIPVDALGVIEQLADGNGAVFNSVEKYAGQRATQMNEQGSFKQFTFITDTEASTTVNANATVQDIAECLVFGKDAFEVTTLSDGAIELIMKEIGSSGSADPMNQRGSYAWKAKQAAMITQPTYMFVWRFSLGDN